MTSVSKNVYIDKLDHIANKYNNIYHRTIKIKPVDVKDNAYIDFNKEVNNEDSKFKVGDYVRISKYKNIFAKGYTPNWSEEAFVIKDVKNTVPWTYVISDHNSKNTLEHFLKQNYKKQSNEHLGQKKLLKENETSRMSNGKGMIILLIAGLIKKDVERNFIECNSIV